MTSQPKKGEIRMKEFIQEVADRRGVTHGSISHEIKAGRINFIKRRAVNSRVVFVIPPEWFSDPAAQTEYKPRPGEVPFKEWVNDKATQMGVKYTTIYMRMVRGTMPWPEMRKVNNQHIFVKV